MRILSAAFPLALAVATSPISLHLPDYNGTDTINSLHNATIDGRSVSSATVPSAHLSRRIVIDGSCSQETVDLITRLMTRIEMISRWAVLGAALRIERGGRGRGRSRPRDTFAESAFQNNFASEGLFRTDISARVRSVVRRRFLEVAEQAARVIAPSDRETRRHQLYHCELPGDPNGICHLGGDIRLTQDGPQWNVICPSFYVLDPVPMPQERSHPNKLIVLVQSLLAGSYINRVQGPLATSDLFGVHGNLDRYVEYAHDLYQHPDMLRLPGT